LVWRVIYPSSHLLFSSQKIPQDFAAKEEAAHGCSVAGGNEGNISLIPPNLHFPEKDEAFVAT
jgi:hypothetical protein